MDRLTEIASFIDLVDIPISLVKVEDCNSITFVKLNKALEQISGLQSADLENKSPYDVLPSRLAESITNNYQTCIRTKRVFTYEGPLSPPNRESWWSFKIAPIIENDKLIGVIGFPNVVNPNKGKEEQRRFAKALQEIQRVNSDLQVLSSTAAHDLRGPLRQAKIVNELIIESQRDLDSNIRDLVLLSDEILQKALTHIDISLANLSAPEDIEIADTTIDMKAWCTDVVAALDPLHRVKFRSTRAVVECEKFVLDIALRNFIENALKFATTKASVSVRQESEQLIFTVQDDGLGFDSEIYSVGEAPPVNNAGSKTHGIGITSAVLLIEQRAGKVWISQADDLHKGGSISFSLPGEMIEFSSQKVA